MPCGGRWQSGEEECAFSWVWHCFAYKRITQRKVACMFEDELEVDAMGTRIYLGDDGLYRGAYFWGERPKFNDVGESTIMGALFSLHDTKGTIERVNALIEKIPETFGLNVEG